MKWEEYSERLDRLQKQIAKDSQAQQQAQDAGDFAKSAKLQAEIAARIDAAERLKSEARAAGLPV
jgi:hypothetical protein